MLEDGKPAVPSLIHDREWTSKCGARYVPYFPFVMNDSRTLLKVGTRVPKPQAAYAELKQL